MATIPAHEPRGRQYDWRDKTAGEAEKTQRPKALKRPNTAKVARRRGSSVVDVNERITLLARERDEALDQQRATSEVLCS